jgi:CheY-like chemotaxis protein
MYQPAPDRNTNETVRVILFLTVYLTICNTVAQFMRIAYQDPMWIVYVLAGCISAIIYDTYKRKSLSNRAISVLLIEDSKLIQQEIKDQFFQSILYQEFVIADTGQKAIDMLKEGHRPDLILVDLTLPDMKGQQILDFLHHSNDRHMATIPTVIFTAPKNVEDGPVIGTNSTAWVQKRDLRSGGLIDAVKVLVPGAIKKDKIRLLP